MPGDSSVDNVLVCSHCRALNAPGTQVCRSCGINLSAFQESQARLLELQRDKSAMHIARLETRGQKAVAQAVAHNCLQLTRQIRAVVVLGAVAAIVITLTVWLYADNLKRWREQLAVQYEQASECLAREEYICARNGFVALLEQEPEYPGANSKLQETRYSVAQQFARASQWQAAVDELDALLNAAPADQRALDLMQNVYERWRQDALARGDLLTTLQVELQLKARFPLPLPSPTPEATTKS